MGWLISTKMWSSQLLLFLISCSKQSIHDRTLIVNAHLSNLKIYNYFHCLFGLDNTNSLHSSCYSFKEVQSKSLDITGPQDSFFIELFILLEFVKLGLCCEWERQLPRNSQVIFKFLCGSQNISSQAFSGRPWNYMYDRTTEHHLFRLHCLRILFIFFSGNSNLGNWLTCACFVIVGLLKLFLNSSES